MNGFEKKPVWRSGKEGPGVQSSMNDLRVNDIGYVDLSREKKGSKAKSE